MATIADLLARTNYNDPNSIQSIVGQQIDPMELQRLVGQQYADLYNQQNAGDIAAGGYYSPVNAEQDGPYATGAWNPLTALDANSGYSAYQAALQAQQQMRDARPEDNYLDPMLSGFNPSVGGYTIAPDGRGGFTLTSGDSGYQDTRFIYNVGQDGTIGNVDRTAPNSSHMSDLMHALALVGGVAGGGMLLDQALYGSVGGGLAAAGGAEGAAGAAGIAGAGSDVAALGGSGGAGGAGWVPAEAGAGYGGLMDTAGLGTGTGSVGTVGGWISPEVGAGAMGGTVAPGGLTGALGAVGDALGSQGGRVAGTIAGSLLAGGGGAGVSAPTDTTADDQRRLQEGSSAINNLFAGRDDAFYKKNVYDPSYEFQQKEIDDQRKISLRQMNFGLARQGLTGGSADVDTHGDESYNYSKALTQASQQAQSQADSARSSDEQTRLNMLGQIRSGLDQQSATESTRQALQTNIDSAKNNTSFNAVNNYLGTIAPITNQFAQNAADRRGRAAGQTWFNNYGSSFGPTKDYYGTRS